MHKSTIGIGARLLVALAAATGASAAMAQALVYGLVDTGIEYVTHANAAGRSQVKMPSLSGSFPSRIGVRGTEDLGAGTQAFFTLESGFAMDTGVQGQGGRLFGRQANVGLKNAYGSLTLGRQYNMTFYASLKADVMGPNIHGISSLDSYLPNARSDNAIAYRGRFADVTVGASYSAGRDASAAGGPAASNCGGEVAGDAKACRQVSALLAYDSGAYGVAAGYDIMYGGAGAAGGLTSSAYHDGRLTLAAYVPYGAAKLGFGLIERRKHAASDLRSELYFLGLSYPFGDSWVFDSQVSRLDVKGRADDATLLVARATCNLSRRTALYGSLGYIRNAGMAAIAVDAGGTTVAGMNQAGIMTGLRHSF